MLITFNRLVNDYCIKKTGILHIGGHQAEELSDYLNEGFDNIVWLEGNPELAEALKERGLNAYHALVSDRDGQDVDFIITNNGQSSSILELEEHLVEHPHIHEVDRKKLKTTKVDTLFEQNGLDPTEYGFINIDIQGAELLALKGMTNILNHTKYIYLEVNTKHLYKDCALIGEIDEYLKKYGFFRVETEMTEHGWGDAFYIKGYI